MIKYLILRSYSAHDFSLSTEGDGRKLSSRHLAYVPNGKGGNQITGTVLKGPQKVGHNLKVHFNLVISMDIE